MKALSGWHGAHWEPHTLCVEDALISVMGGNQSCFIHWKPFLCELYEYIYHIPPGAGDCLFNSPCCLWRKIHTICRGHQNSQGWDVPVKIEEGTCFKTIWNCQVAQAVWCHREKHKGERSFLSWILGSPWVLLGGDGSQARAWPQVLRMKRHFCSMTVHWSVWKELVEI